MTCTALHRPELEMIATRDAYTAATRLYLPETYCLDEKSLFRDINAAMNKLQGETLRMALRHLYIKWGDYSDEGREQFASDLLALANARNAGAPNRPARRRALSRDTAGESGTQAALF